MSELSQQATTKLMTNRVALVTGASRGIGAATTKLLASHSAAVGVNYYANEAATESVVNAIAAGGGKAIVSQSLQNHE